MVKEAFCLFSVLALQLLFLVLASAREYSTSNDITGASSTISRNDFPPDFVFGAGSSAYQVEGGASLDGRKPSIWDTYAHAGKVGDKSNADIASDQYHKYKDDVKLMKEMGLDAYRMSISWSRLIPDGRGDINPKGLDYYNNFINELIRHGIKPHITLSHFDIPQVLEDEYNSLLSPKFIDDFTAYADVCFREFGDRVKSWSTFNEPNVQTVLGNDIGCFPPERCSYPFGVVNCSDGDSRTEAYVSAHNILLAHSSAVKLYRTNYQKQRGQIGITLLAMWGEPLSESLRDSEARKRAVDFHLGWFLHPLVYGSYPAIMRKIVGSRLPSFDDSEAKQLKGSFDFIGLNHYSVVYVYDFHRNLDDNKRDWIDDVSVGIGDPSTNRMQKNTKDFLDLRRVRFAESGFPLDPWGMQRLLEYVRSNYNNPAVEITENGNPLPISVGQNDTARVKYLKVYIESLLTSLRMGSNIRGYFVWSFIDCFEFLFGYTNQYGLYQVDFNDNDRKRSPKLSAQWYTKFLTKHRKEINSYSY